MAILSDALMSRDSIAIREEIGKRVMNVLPAHGQWFDDMDVIDVGRASGFEVGRDGLIKKRFMGSITGSVRGGNNYNHRALYGDKTTALTSAPFYLHALQTTGPNPLLSPVPSPYGQTMELYSYEATVPLTVGQLQLQVLPANIKEQIVPIFDGFAKNQALYTSVHFFTNRELDNRLGTLGSNSGATGWALDNTNKTLTFYPLEKTTSRFVPGQELDLYDGSTSGTSGSDTRLNERGGIRIPMWVQSVSHMTNTVVIAIDPAEDLTAAPWTSIQNNSTEATTSLTVGDYVCWADQNTGAGLKSPYGWRDWFKAGGTGNANKRLLGSAAITTTANDYIDVEQRPFAQSYRRDSIGTLTQQDLELYLDEAVLALQAYGWGLDSVIMSRGIKHAMWQLDLARSYLVNNRPSTQENYGLAGGFAITTPSGGKLRGYVSPMIEDGVIVAGKFKNNWKVMTLPNPQGGGSNSQLSPDSGPSRSIPVIFKGKLFGYPTDKVPIINAGGEHLDGVQFPCMARYNFMPQEQIPGLVLTGVSTSRAYSSPA
jgi:hypothetical protein